MRLREVVPLGGDGEPIEARLEPGDSVSGTFDPFTWYYFALDGLTSGRYTVSFSKGAIEAIYAPGNLITDQPHGAARYTFDVRSTGTPQTRYVWLVVWGRRRQLHRVPWMRPCSTWWSADRRRPARFLKRRIL